MQHISTLVVIYCYEKLEFLKWKSALNMHLPTPWIELKGILECDRTHMKSRGNEHNCPPSWNCQSCKVFLYFGTYKFFFEKSFEGRNKVAKQIIKDIPFTGISVNALRNKPGATFASLRVSLTTYVFQTPDTIYKTYAR